MNLGVNGADEWPIFSQPSTGHIEGNDTSWLLHSHNWVGEPQWTVITPDSQLDAACIGPEEGSTCHTR